MTNDSVDAILSTYYERLAADEPVFSRGAIAWAPSAFLLEQFHEVNFSDANPAVDFGKGYITLRERTVDECHNPASGVFNHYPIHAVRLRANECWAALKFKLRKVLVLSVGTELTGLGERATRRLGAKFPDCVLCAPIYTLRSDDEPNKFPPSFIEAIKAYCFPMVFYLRPEGGMREACVRFDRIQALSRRFLRSDKMRLSDDCMKVFDHWLSNYLFGVLPKGSEILEYRALLRQQDLLRDGMGCNPVEAS